MDSDEKLRTFSKEQQRRAVNVSASVLTSDPYQEACQVLPDVNALTRMTAKQAYEEAVGDLADQRHAPQRLRRSAIEGPSDLRHGHRERLGDLPSPSR